jgi:hypothetical protein
LLDANPVELNEDESDTLGRDGGKIFELLETTPVEDIEDEIDELAACALDLDGGKGIELLKAMPVELNEDEADIMEVEAWRVDRDEDTNCDELSEELTAAGPNAYRLKR